MDVGLCDMKQAIRGTAVNIKHIDLILSHS